MNKKMEKKPLGSVLLELGIIQPDQLKQALEYQEKEQVKLGQALFRLGILSKKNLYRALAHQYHYPYIDIEEIEIPASLISVVPASIAKKYPAIPVEWDYENEKIRMCMAPPFELSVIEEMEKELGKKIEFVLTTPEQLRQAILHYYPDEAN
jgi:type IV pilus assembly protein PilB